MLKLNIRVYRKLWYKIFHILTSVIEETLIISENVVWLLIYKGTSAKWFGILKSKLPGPRARRTVKERNGSHNKKIMLIKKCRNARRHRPAWCDRSWCWPCPECICCISTTSTASSKWRPRGAESLSGSLCTSTLKSWVHSYSCYLWMQAIPDCDIITIVLLYKMGNWMPYCLNVNLGYLLLKLNFIV